MAAISDRNLVARTLAKILENADDLYERYRYTITEAKMDMGLAFATLRIEGPGFSRGTSVKIYPKSQAWNEPSQLIIEWDDQPRKKRVFSQGDCGKLAVRQLLCEPQTV